MASNRVERLGVEGLGGDCIRSQSRLHSITMTGMPSTALTSSRSRQAPASQSNSYTTKTGLTKTRCDMPHPTSQTPHTAIGNPRGCVLHALGTSAHLIRLMPTQDKELKPTAKRSRPPASPGRVPHSTVASARGDTEASDEVHPLEDLAFGTLWSAEAFLSFSGAWTSSMLARTARAGSSGCTKGGRPNTSRKSLRNCIMRITAPSKVRTA